MNAPVTVSITRRIAPEHADQMTAWIRAGSALASGFPGFLGTGWVRPSRNSEQWHMLYRFDSTESLATWEGSEQRRWWLGAAQGLVGESTARRHTGIEGWFDEPTHHDEADLRTGQDGPPRWKQSVMIWLAFFPLSLLATWLMAHLFPDLAMLPRVFVSTVLMTPMMTYLVLPRMTKLLGRWLAGESAGRLR